MKYKPARYKKNRRCAKRREIYDRIIPVSVEVVAGVGHDPTTSGSSHILNAMPYNASF